MNTQDDRERKSRQIFSALHRAFGTEFLEADIDGRSIALTPAELREAVKYMTKEDASIVLQEWNLQLAHTKKQVIIRNCVAFLFFTASVWAGFAMFPKHPTYGTFLYSYPWVPSLLVPGAAIWGIYRLMENYGPRIQRMESLIKELSIRTI